MASCKLYGAAILVTYLYIVSVELASPPTKPHEDLFHRYDKNTDTFLSRAECSNLWFDSFDANNNSYISKPEFEVRWTYLNLADKVHSPLFFERIDKDQNKEVDHHEVTGICRYFDDDGDGFISKFEYDFNWAAFFSVGP